jgi:uncharacterized membrane protein
MQRSVQQTSGESAPLGLASTLGWASLGLGIPQTTMPGRFVRALGIEDDLESRAWTLAVGVREYAAAAGILAVEWPRPALSLWSRVAGDVMDFTLLARALRSKSFSRIRTLGAMGAVVGIGIADVIAAARTTNAPPPREDLQPGRVRAAITVRRPRQDVYAFWHDFQNLPRFMAHVESVQTVNGRSHWRAKAPVGTVEWDAEVVDDRPGELISWRSIGGSGVGHSGMVRFVDAPGDRGTEIHVDMQYSAPGGPFGEAAAKLFGEEPEQQTKDDLRRFKQVMETGEVVRSEGSPEGSLARRLVKQRPAQPLSGARAHEHAGSAR